MANDSRIIVLAPARPPAELAQQLVQRLRRADHVSHEADDAAQLYGDLFLARPAGWPVAALTRQHDAGDADDRAWLRADPAHFRADMAHVRLLACGNLALTQAESDALVATLAPVFGDEGFELSAPVPDRWYLRAFASNAAPDFPAMAAPERALGRDIFELWPEDDAGRRWRRLFSEVQIVLNRHPVNLARAAAGQPVVNGVWFHGAGRQPTKIETPLTVLQSSDDLLRAWASAAGIARVDDVLSGSAAGVALLDLRDDVGAGLTRLLEAWSAGRLREVEWRSPKGRWLHRPWHRWRFWRR